MAQSLLLDTVAWDLVVDVRGNIAVASSPYSDAQDAACAIRLFLGELYYDTKAGVDYWGQILGKFPSAALFKAKIQAAALTATNVVSAVVVITSWQSRNLSGVVVVTNNQGVTSQAAWAVPLGTGAV